MERESSQQKILLITVRIGLACRGKVPLRLDSVVVYAATTSLLSFGSLVGVLVLHVTVVCGAHQADTEFLSSLPLNYSTRPSQLTYLVAL
jgi:hypothetical protein